MKSQPKNPVAAHRERLKRDGIVRLEVKVGKNDVTLMRRIADVLADPQQAPEARSILRKHFTGPAPTGLKALLVAAPLEGIELDRIVDTGRPVDL